MTAESYIKTKDHLTVSFSDGETATVYPSHPRYRDIIAALTAKDYESVRKLSIPTAAVQDKINKVTKRGIGSVVLKAGVVYYNDKPIHNTLTDRIVAMANEGFDIEPMCKFLSNLKDNPSFRAVNELYGFLEKGNLPITEDGYFLAYKRVRQDYTDVHSGKFSNAIGQVVEMARNEVNEDPNQTCSQGLHFCSRDYLPHFAAEAGNRTVILKINPADVVAIPTDYQNTKGRTCRYEVIGELEHNNEKPLEGAFRPSDNYQAPADTSDDDDEDWNDDDWVDDSDWNEDEDEEQVDPAQANPTLAPAAPTGPIQALYTDNGTVVRTFADVKEAAKWALVTPSAIRRVLSGERKTTGGYAWKDVGADATQPHGANLADLHANGTLKGGRPHGV